MRLIAQNQPIGNSASSGIGPIWVYWQVLFLVGAGVGMSTTGYSIFDAIKTIL